MQQQDFARNLMVILGLLKVGKFKGAPKPKFESRRPSFFHGLLIYTYFKDGTKKMAQNRAKGHVYNGVKHDSKSSTTVKDLIIKCH